MNDDFLFYAPLLYGGGVRKPASPEDILQWLTGYDGVLPFVDKKTLVDSPVANDVNCLLLDGVGDHIQVQEKFVIPADGIIDYSITCKPTSFAAQTCLLSDRGATSDAWNIALHIRATTGVPLIYVGRSGSVLNLSPVALNEWVTIRVVIDTATGFAQGYLDGIPDASGTYAGVFNNSTGNVVVGQEQATSGKQFSGYISNAIINGLMQYPLAGGARVSCYDASGNGNEGTISINSDIATIRATDDGLLSLNLDNGFTYRGNIDLVFVAGQSNALGYSNDPVEFDLSMPQYLKDPQYNVRSWLNTNVQRRDHPLEPQDKIYWGTELNYCYQISQNHSRPVAVVKVAFGSTSLAYTWQKGSGALEDMYAKLVAKYQEALSDLQALGYVVNVRQFVWIQGEDDAILEVDSLAYQANWNQFWSDFTTDTGIATSTSVILAPLSPLYVAGFASNVKAGQADIITASPFVEELDVSDAVWSNPSHYSGEFLNTMGERCATNFLSKGF